MSASEYTHTLVHEAGHVVAAYFFHPGSEPDVAIYGARRGRTEYNTTEDIKVKAIIGVAGIVATKMILQEPMVITEATMEERGAGEDHDVVRDFLIEDFTGEAYIHDHELGMFADEVEAKLVPYIGQIEAIVAAIRAHKGKLTVAQVAKVLDH